MAQQSLMKKNEIAQVPTNQVMETVSASREIASIQGMVFMAKQFPRNEQVAISRILKSCERVGLAAQAAYSYPKGGTQVEGPSIRLAEALAQSWGNMDFGVRELDQTDEESVMESYAWDLETNTRQSKIFSVPHVIHTNRGDKKLTDPREIYENAANNGARRLRACILGVIPGDIVDMAVEACSKTMASNTKSDEKTLTALESAFSAIGVSRTMIEAKIGRKFEAITVLQINQLRKNYASIKDGLTTAVECFSAPEAEKEPAKEPEKQSQPTPELATMFEGGGL